MKTMPKMDYATKNDLKEVEGRLTKRIDGLDGAVSEIKKTVLNSEVKILGELQKMRENIDAHSFSHMRIDEDMADHEKRITNLESAKT